MNFYDKIILLLYFPQFHSPINSRFESLFVSLIKKKNCLNKKINISKKIYPNKIANNEDKRTSIIIKGIPKYMNKNEIRNLIDKFGNINYLHLINSSINGNDNNLIVYTNVINYKTIIPIFMNLRDFKIERNGKIYNLKIMYSSVQGKKQLKEYFKKKNFLIINKERNC